jgi:hypothetical protein
MSEVETQLSAGSEVGAASWKRGEEHREFWRKNHARFAREFPAEYVAVESGEVVAHSPSLHALVGYLEGRGISPGEVFIEYLAVNPASMMPR